MRGLRQRPTPIPAGGFAAAERNVSQTNMNSQPVQTQAILGLVLAISFGLWWLLFPESVIRLYTRFNRGKVARPIGIRLLGAMWVAFVVLATWFNLTSR